MNTSAGKFNKKIFAIAEGGKNMSGDRRNTSWQPSVLV
jgi:hypothetical protein